MIRAIDVRGVSKQFVLRHNRDLSLKGRVLSMLQRRRETREEFWALKDVSLSIARGESIGLVGRNGSGKSTFLKLLAGIHRPTSGQLLISARARIGSMIELGVGFHPDLTGTENVFLNASIHGFARSQIEEMYPRIVEYSGLGRFMDVPLKNYSSGMHMRLGFAVAANMDPDILLLDEIFAVGDEDFQKQCKQTMKQFASEGRTLIFVSHNADSVRAMCNRVCVLDDGRLVFDGEVEEGLAEYRGLTTGGSRVVRGRKSTGDGDGGQAVAHGTGTWPLEILRREGLQPEHRVLEITFGETMGSDVLQDYVRPVRYQHWEVTRLSEALRPFDYALMSPLASLVSLNGIARCLAMIARAMAPGGRIYVTWTEQPEASDVGDLPPFGYPFALVAGLGTAIGLRPRRLDGQATPSGESVLVFERA